MNVTRLREEKEPQVNQGNTLNSDVGNLRGDKKHCRKRADMGSPRTRDPDPCRWGVTGTIPTPYTWGHTSTLTAVTSPPQTLHQGSHILTHQGDPTSPDPQHLRSQVHTHQVTPPPQTLHLASHVHTHQVNTLPRPCTWGHTSTAPG